MPAKVTTPPVKGTTPPVIGGVDLRVPPSGELSAALGIFFKILNRALRLRFEEATARRMGAVADQTFRQLLTNDAITVLTNALIALQERADDRISVSSLYEEILFFNWKFREALEDATEVENMGMHYGNEAGDWRSNDLLEGGETIKGSIESLVGRLPPWLKRLFDIVSELMKLKRLDFGGGR